MKTNTNGLSIVKKLRLLFAIILAVLVFLVVDDAIFMTDLRNQTEYLSDYVVERNILLSNMQSYIREISSRVLTTFNSSAWRNAASEDAVAALHAEMDSRVQGILAIGREYLQAISEDTFLDERFGLEKRESIILLMHSALEHINELHQYYRIDFATLQDAYFTNIMAEYAMPAIAYIEEIRMLNLAVIIAVGETLNSTQNSHFWKNLVTFSLTTAFVFGVFWLIIDNIRKRMNLFEARAEQIMQGNFHVDMKDGGNDELSRLSNVMGDVVDVFSGMIAQVTKVAGDISAGKVDSRLEESQFQGSFHDAACSINLLAEKVMDAAAVKAEEEYYGYVTYLMDTVPIVIAFFDEDFKLIGCNDEAVRRYGLDSKQEYIDNFTSFSPPLQPNGRDSELMAKHYLHQALTEGYAKFEWIHLHKNGEHIPTEIQCYRGEFMGQTAIYTYALDLRDLYKAIEETKRSASAEESSKAKSRFLARMSHEIRTPISAVLGISEIQLQNPSLPMSVEESFAKIYNSSQTLLGIINDILDLSKIESEKMEILNEDYEAASLMNDIVQLNVFRLGSKKIKFEVEIDPNIPVLLTGDELRIKQVMNNLLSNAFKYTESGTVSFTAKFLQRDEESLLFFKVADTGCGMSEEDLKQLFTEFARFNEKEHRNIEGIGLGMAIVDNLVRLMGAKMQVESKFGAGTVITLELPQKRASDEVLGEELADNLQNFKMSGRYNSKSMMFTPDPMPYGKVLVVDDVDTNLYVAKGLMSFYNLNVETCDSGYKAIELVKRGKVYDIIFMDQMMPGMDGIEANKIIRESGYKHPVVALTANALIGQSDMFMENSFDGFISKPIDTSHLNSILNKFIRDRHPLEVVEAARQEAQQRAQQTLTHDDGSEMRQLEKSIRREFAKSQKNAAKDIRAALAASDGASCRRFAHTLKGLALTIKEGALADSAGKLEHIFEKSGISDDTAEVVGELLDRLEGQLAAVLEGIPVEGGLSLAAAGGQGLDLPKILAELEPLLHEHSADALETAKSLRAVPQAAILARQIEEYDFEGALTSLPVLLKEVNG